MISVEDARRIACDALRDKVDYYISNAASEGRGSVCVSNSEIPDWLKAELITNGFILSQHEQKNATPSIVVEVFWGAVKNDK